MRPTDFIYNLNQRNLEYLRKTISAFLNRNSLIFSNQLNLETHSAMKTSYQKTPSYKWIQQIIWRLLLFPLTCVHFQVSFAKSLGWVATSLDLILDGVLLWNWKICLTSIQQKTVIQIIFIVSFHKIL